MRFGWIGGTLVVGGCALFMIAAAIAVGGGSVGLGIRDVGGLVLAASLALVACGAAVLGVAGPRPLRGRVVRVGLGALAVALVSYLAASIMAEESLPMFVLFIGGPLATFLGSMVTGLSLVRVPGLSRVAGSLVLAGLLLILLGTISRGNAVAVLGLIAVLLGGTGVGVLGVKGVRSAPAVPA